MSKNSVGRNSLIMASGTIASRITGQLRTIFLVGALGATGVAANAYQAGAQLPQVIFNLISTGIFNAVLVPQIVRTLKRRDAEEQLSKLITLAIVLLAVITLIMMAGTPVLTSIYLDSSWTAPQRALANAFTLWCMPQVFFYGLYAVIGQILASKGRFATYAWSSVGANVISCIGFGAFMLMFGNAASQPLEFWTSSRIALTAGMWTLGVAFQGLILFAPLMHCGIRYRPRFGLRGFGLRSMGKVAFWSLLMVIANQLMNIVVTRVNTGAPSAGGDLNGIAGNAAYQYAFTIYILPYSVIAASVATAVFPRISEAIAAGRIGEARDSFSSSLRTNSLAMFWFTAVMVVIPVPLIKALIPSASFAETQLIAPTLIMLSFALVFTSAFLLGQRAFYAWEDGRSPFLWALAQNVVQVILLLVLVQLTPPARWTEMAATSMSLSYLVTFPVMFMLLRRRFGGDLDGRRLASAHARMLLAAVAAGLVGWAVSEPITRLVGADMEAGRLGWVQSVAICALVGLVMAVVYAALLWMMRVSELRSALELVTARLSRRRGGTQPVGKPETTDSSHHGKHTKEYGAKGNTPGETLPPVFPPKTKMTAEYRPSFRGAMHPQPSDTLFNRYTLVQAIREERGLSAWKANDRVLDYDCQLFLVTARDTVADIDLSASMLTLEYNDRFTQVLKFHRAGDCCMLVCKDDAGQSLSEYLRGSGPLNFDAVRSIIGDVAYALERTHDGMISTDTIRVSKSGVQIADAPLSVLLAEPTHAPNAITGEPLLVRQLAAVTYALLTRTPSQELGDPSTLDLSRLPEGTPGEFRIIIARGLGLNVEGLSSEPMCTIGELRALLGSWVTVPDLYPEAINLPSQESEPSIAMVALKPVDEDKLATLPNDAITPEKLPKLDISASDVLVPTQAIDVRALRQQEGEVPVNGNPFQQFAPSDESDAAGAEKPADAGDSVVSEEETADTVNAHDLNIAAAVMDDRNDGLAQVVADTATSNVTEALSVGETTTRMPIFGLDKPLSEQLNEAEKASADWQHSKTAANDEATAEDTSENKESQSASSPSTPPSFAPVLRGSENGSNDASDNAMDEDELSDQRLFGSMTTKAAAIAIGVVVIVAAAAFAIVGLAGNGGTKGGDTPWPEDEDLSNVPFGDTTPADNEATNSATEGASDENGDILFIDAPQVLS